MSSLAPLVTLSIVSHGQGSLIAPLLQDLLQLEVTQFEVVLTLNIPEDEGFFADVNGLRMKVVRNRGVKGFGANHNAAFDVSEGEIFVIVNPDIRAQSFDLPRLIDTFELPRAGACGPSIVSATGASEDSPRRFPTIARLAHRSLSGTHEPDYATDRGAIAVDWVAGMFVAFRREAFVEIGGFDERYFMYMEDVDICRRLRAAGWQVYFQPGTEVVHEAQRQSRRRLRHIVWHLRSLFRYLLLHPVTGPWRRP